MCACVCVCMCVCVETTKADGKRENFRNIQILLFILKPWGRGLYFSQGTKLTDNMQVWTA